MAHMEGVVQLINRLQGAATLLGDNAAGDRSLPSLWSMLPSIVVIGGQVRVCTSLCVRCGNIVFRTRCGWCCALRQATIFSHTPLMCDQLQKSLSKILISWRCPCRAQGRAQCSKLLLERTSYRVGQALSRAGRSSCSWCVWRMQMRRSMGSFCIRERRRSMISVRSLSALIAAMGILDTGIFARRGAVKHSVDL